jgi:hypothetical protein
MKKNMMLCFAIMLFLGASLTTMAQSIPAPPILISDTVAHALQEKMPGWAYHSVTPIYEQEQVIIQQWVSGERSVKVAILPHLNEQEAKATLRDFVAHNTSLEKLLNLGDEAYIEKGINKSVVFRKRNFTVYISIIADDLTAEAPLNKEFAKHIADALHTL